ncbi:MAG: HTTM domain-containing protein, partial [Rhodothermaceae bacterium]|nr:HTTM domain-containing protein [Rhodothermaceae bacterium]
MKNIYERAESLLGIDARSLGLFRIALGVVLLYDLVIRSFSLNAHYTDQGIVSRHVLKGLSDNPILLSLNMLSGDPLWQGLLFFLAACFTVCLIIGYRSQLACFGCLVLMLSIHVRNPFVNNLGDWFLLHLLFWGCLLPLGVRFSIDVRRLPSLRQLPRQILSIATLGVLVQIAALYFFSVLKKNSPVWHTDGTAIHYALRLDRFVTHIGEWVLSLPYDWLTTLTSATLFLEQWGPILLFIPFFIGPIRIVLVSGFVLFHSGLALTLELGIFPFVCISAWFLVLPGLFWETLISFRYRKPRRNI